MVYGIISEFNPFHKGHEYLFTKARECGAELIVAVMSGNAVQRGELAILDKYRRAEAALRCGADLVVELPYPWCASGAESFARCGVHIVKELCDCLFFGSECGDLELLRRGAEIAANKEFVDIYKASLEDNVGSAKLYFDLLKKECGSDFSSNDILGIEYIKSCSQLSASLNLQTVKRVGEKYLEREIGASEYQSATAIRQLIFMNGAVTVGEYLPQSSYEMVANAEKEGALLDPIALDRAEKLFFRLNTPEGLGDIADADLGLLSRICKCASEIGEGDLLSAVSTKRYTDSRLRRVMLFALTGVLKDDVRSLPTYTNLLGANLKGRQYLASKRGKLGIDILGKPSDIPENDRSKRQAELSRRLEALFTLSRVKARPEGDSLRHSPVIIDK